LNKVANFLLKLQDTLDVEVSPSELLNDLEEFPEVVTIRKTPSVCEVKNSQPQVEEKIADQKKIRLPSIFGNFISVAVFIKIISLREAYLVVCLQ